MVRSSYLLRVFCLWSKEQGMALVPSHPCCMTWNRSFALSASSSVWVQQRHRTSWWSEDESLYHVVSGPWERPNIRGPSSCWVWERGGSTTRNLTLKPQGPGKPGRVGHPEPTLSTANLSDRFFPCGAESQVRRRAQEILVKSSVPVPLQPYLLPLSALFLLL